MMELSGLHLRNVEGYNFDGNGGRRCMFIWFLVEKLYEALSSSKTRCCVLNLVVHVEFLIHITLVLGFRDQELNQKVG